MKMTQQEFAVTALKGAVVTVGLYESSRPPTEQGLTALEEVARRESDLYRDDAAKRQQFLDIADRFRYLRYEAAKDKVGIDFVIDPKAPERDMRGLAFLKLDGFWEVFSAQLLQLLWGILRNGTAAQKRKAQKVLDGLQDAVRSAEPMAFDAMRAVTLAAAREEELIKTVKKSKKRTTTK